MSSNYISRKFWHNSDSEVIEVLEADLSNYTCPLVVLGEPGMGKTELLYALARKNGYAYCTARQLAVKANPKSLINSSGVLVIDALDEMAAKGEGDAIDRVLFSLGKLNYPRFILSCRVADWRSATSTSAINEQYDVPPLLLHLKPFTKDEVLTYLSNRRSKEFAETITNQLDSLGLSDWLGNPQSLELLLKATATGELPQTRSELFEMAVYQLAQEHNDAKQDNQISVNETLLAAGAACAALILTGSEAIIKKASLNALDGELVAKELYQFPEHKNTEQVLGTRLFSATKADTFKYYHRSIAEYLGARWLSSHADTHRKRRRLMALFMVEGLVPVSLRGIYSWLAKDSLLANEVIFNDPMSLMEYGDTDTLSVEEARAFLRAFENQLEIDPEIRQWRSYKCRGIAQRSMLNEVRNYIENKKGHFALRYIVLNSIIGSELAMVLIADLNQVVKDTDEIYSLRRLATDALGPVLAQDDWNELIQSLKAISDEDSLRLAIETIDNIGYVYFSDELITELFCSYSSLRTELTGMHFALQRNLPNERLPSFLDCLASAAPPQDSDSNLPGNNEVADLAYHLIARCLQITTIDAHRIWNWLLPFTEEDTYSSGREELAQVLLKDSKLRRSIQKYVLIEEPGEASIWKRYIALTQRSRGFVISESDAITLLDTFATNSELDPRWKEVVELVSHDAENGKSVREKAAMIVGNATEHVGWLDALAAPKAKYDWQIKQEEKAREREKEKVIAFAKAKEMYSQDLQQLRQGIFPVAFDPARAYLGCFNDFDNTLSNRERVESWLGPSLADAALEGFEAYLTKIPSEYSAQDLAFNHASGQLYNTQFILIAALLQRFFSNVALTDLTDDRVIAAYISLQNIAIADSTESSKLLEIIERELKARGKFVEALCLQYESQFKAKKQHVFNLSDLMRSNELEVIAVDLAKKWLPEFDELTFTSEETLADRLLKSKQIEFLKDLSRVRRIQADKKKAHLWLAIGLIVDFDKTSSDMALSEIPKDLIWQIRERTFDADYGNSSSVYHCSIDQLCWIVANFRNLWPVVAPPKGVRHGNANSWDANRYLQKLINRIANDTSPKAINALSVLQTMPHDGYSDHIRSASYEQFRKKVEGAYEPPTLAQIAAVTKDDAPTTIRDLQAWVLEELSIVQAKIRSDDVDSWRGFYDDNNAPHDEERCRDHLISLLRQGSKEVTYDPEAHVADDKEVDIACSVKSLRIPVEVKGQWHRALWTSTDGQLDRLYASDWRAEGYGIYLVIWAGVSCKKKPTSPGRGIPTIKSSDEMLKILIERSNAAKHGLIKIVMLDITRGAS